jgi:hypothetical protein
MALLDSKQLNPKLTGSFVLSGSTQTFIGNSEFQGSITASSDISASGNLYIDGTANIDSLVVTDAFTHGSTTWNEDAGALSVTGSDFFWKSTGGGFDIYDNSDVLMFKIENKMVVLGALDTTPTATAGGIFYSGSSEWFMGYGTSPT